MEELRFNETDTSEIYKTIIGALEEGVDEPLNPGDERRIFGEALVAVLVSVYSMADDAARQGLLRYARGTVLDALGERTNTPRAASKKATTILRFSTQEAAKQNIFIPAGTRATPNGTLYFATDASAVLLAGEIHVDVPSSGMEGGNAYNGFEAGSITTIVDIIPHITGVTNTYATEGGDDGEPYTEAGDNQYRERIRLSTDGFSTAGPIEAYRYHALGADASIISVSITSPEPGEVLIVPLLKDGEIPSQELLDKVYKACNADEVRPLTDFVKVDAPTIKNFEINIEYYVTKENEKAVVSAVEAEGGAISQYTTWQTGALGRDINPDQLRKHILDAGALRLDVIEPVFAEVEETEVARLTGEIVVTRKVVSE